MWHALTTTLSNPRLHTPIRLKLYPRTTRKVCNVSRNLATLCINNLERILVLNKLPTCCTQSSRANDVASDVCYQSTQTCSTMLHCVRAPIMQSNPSTNFSLTMHINSRAIRSAIQRPIVSFFTLRFVQTKMLGTHDRSWRTWIKQPPTTIILIHVHLRKQRSQKREKLCKLLIMRNSVFNIQKRGNTRTHQLNSHTHRRHQTLRSTFRRKRLITNQSTVATKHVTSWKQVAHPLFVQSLLVPRSRKQCITLCALITSTKHSVTTTFWQMQNWNWHARQRSTFRFVLRFNWIWHTWIFKKQTSLKIWSTWWKHVKNQWA